MGWSVGGVNDATAVLLDHGEYDGLMFLEVANSARLVGPINAL